MTPKIVFLDIDGTLVTPNGDFPDSAVQALTKAREQGHKMVICSGRARCQIANWFPMELLDGLITAAGACVYWKGELVSANLFTPEQVAFQVNYYTENRMPFFLQAEDNVYAASWVRNAGMKLFSTTGMNAEQVERLIGTVVFLDDPSTVPGVEKSLYYQCTKPFEQVKKEMGPEYNITDSSFKISRFCDGEVTPKGIDKSAGMAALLKACGMSREDTIAFGDGPNDMEMIEYARLGVAMGNGIPQLKEVADMVCGPVDEDGLANAFSDLGLLG